MRIELELDETQAAMLELWRGAQPVRMNPAEAALALMVAGMLMVDGAFTRSGRTGPLWTGSDETCG